MYEMSFLWNNNVCCGCTGFLHILWAFIAANMREGEGHNRLLISWMQEFPTVRRGGSESQHGFSASSESVKQATFIKWLWRFLSWWWKSQSPNRKPEPPRQLPASLKEQKGGGNTNICEEAVCADLAWILVTPCVFGGGFVESKWYSAQRSHEPPLPPQQECGTAAWEQGGSHAAANS